MTITPLGGRRSKHTPGVERELVRLLKVGNTRETAAQAVGVGVSTLRRWCQLSERFRAVIAQAEAEAETLYVNALTSKAVEGDVAAIKFWLTHQRSDAWRPPAERREVSGQVGLVVVRQVYDEPAAADPPQLPPPALPGAGTPGL